MNKLPIGVFLGSLSELSLHQAQADDLPILILPPSAERCARYIPQPQIPPGCRRAQTVRGTATVTDPTQLQFVVYASEDYEIFSHVFNVTTEAPGCGYIESFDRFACQIDWPIPEDGRPYWTQMQYQGAPIGEPECVVYEDLPK